MINKYEYRIIEDKNKDGELLGYICVVFRNGEMEGRRYDAKDLSDVNEWWKLYLGAYGRRSGNEGNEGGVAA
jgi:hypothetical protein